ncbi:anti-sigma B factor antagonist [Allocatelliglobosispora scoriae]|uniref:Anti-sigma factor antagonist n=1 Tax=Allocatelliglobosispora scoriae TaxID=643052 RepID=A0A841BN95_9ACTN|nr:STAS domain-containing protein [Allocatelliglobosispora scoriae]MBB5868756.1 anti-sigma B factor antagonist [Allocatelliglobosispora scoriae]
MSTHVDHDGTVRLTLDGEIDLQVKDELDTTLNDVLASDSPGVLIDVTAVTFLDSSGIGTLVRGYRQAEIADKGFRITGAQGMVLRVLQVTGVAELLAAGPAAARSADAS